MPPDPATVPETAAAKPMVRIWDPFVRVCHWTVAAAFFIAYFTEDDTLTLHVWAGYAVGVLVVLRILWGFIGPTHARFTDFLYPPWQVWAYLTRLAAFRAKRYLGHSPAGGAMALVLFAGLLATVWTGLELYAAEENAGPLARGAAPSAVAEAGGPSDVVRVSEVERDAEEDDEREERDERGRAETDERGGRDGDEEDEAGEAWEDLHEALAEVMFVLVLLHIGGVALSSLVHRENLVMAMITGLKRAQ